MLVLKEMFVLRDMVSADRLVAGIVPELGGGTDKRLLFCREEAMRCAGVQKPQTRPARQIPGPE